MEIILIILFIILGCIVSSVSSRAGKSNITALILSFSLVFIFCGLVTYTADWGGYTTWIEEQTEKEYIFNLISEYLLTNNYSYQVMHIGYHIVIGILLVWFISKFYRNVFIVCLIYLSINYLFYTNQIRFFLAYSLFYFVFYSYYIENNKKKAIVLGALALLNHTSVALLIPFYFLMNTKVEKLLSIVVKIAVVISFSYFFLKNILFSIILGDSRYITYLEVKESTLLGGLYTFLPSLVLLLLVYKVFSKLKRNEDFLADKKLMLLYRLSVIPYMYFVIALFMQIMGHRFIISAALFQILFCLVSLKYMTSAEKTKFKFYYFAVFALIILYMYSFSSIIFGIDSSYWIETKQMLESNLLYQYILNL